MYGSKRFDAASAYEYVNSVTYNVDVESDDVTVEDRGAVEYNQGVGVVSERGSDEEMDEDSVLHPHDEGFGKVEVDESGGLEIIYPTGTPSSPAKTSSRILLRHASNWQKRTTAFT